MGKSWTDETRPEKAEGMIFEIPSDKIPLKEGFAHFSNVRRGRLVGRPPVNELDYSQKQLDGLSQLV